MFDPTPQEGRKLQTNWKQLPIKSHDSTSLSYSQSREMLNNFQNSNASIRLKDVSEEEHRAETKQSNYSKRAKKQQSGERSNENKRTSVGIVKDSRNTIFMRTGSVEKKKTILLVPVDVAVFPKRRHQAGDNQKEKKLLNKQRSSDSTSKCNKNDNSAYHSHQSDINIIKSRNSELYSQQPNNTDNDGILTKFDHLKQKSVSSTPNKSPTFRQTPGNNYTYDNVIEK